MLTSSSWRDGSRPVSLIYLRLKYRSARRVHKLVEPMWKYFCFPQTCKQFSTPSIWLVLADCRVDSSKSPRASQRVAAGLAMPAIQIHQRETNHHLRRSRRRLTRQHPLISQRRPTSPRRLTSPRRPTSQFPQKAHSLRVTRRSLGKRAPGGKNSKSTPRTLRRASHAW